MYDVGLSPSLHTANPEDFSVVAIASSLGGIGALQALLKAIPSDFPLPILLCQHVGRGRPSMLAQILSRTSRLPVVSATDGTVPLPGTVYVAPPDVHLTVDGNGRLAVRHDAPVNHCRPSADVLFGSMADAYGSGSIAVVLTGMGRDGARGATAIRSDQRRPVDSRQRLARLRAGRIGRCYRLERACR
jgi:two-component system chemotaxis response regulator CheB